MSINLYATTPLFVTYLYVLYAYHDIKGFMAGIWTIGCTWLSNLFVLVCSWDLEEMDGCS